MGIKYKPLYSGPKRSGICECGHFWDEHELLRKNSKHKLAETEEQYIPWQCHNCDCELYWDKEQK